MIFEKVITPNNNDPANACSSACKNQTQQVAKDSYNANHDSYKVNNLRVVKFTNYFYNFF